MRDREHWHTCGYIGVKHCPHCPKPRHVAHWLDRMVSALWRWTWQHWLSDGDKVIRVKGWRTALVESRSGQRSTITPLFRWERTNEKGEPPV
jgi:hypothetical protein